MNELSNQLVNQTSLQEAKAALNAASSISAVKEAEAIRVAMASAKYYPRDITTIEDKIVRLCASQRLALTAEYSYPRGGQDITGPSIKLVEAVAQCYGNILTGVNEVQRFADKSECTAFAWDLENNVRRDTSFTVPHFRDTKTGKQPLRDDRDIRELISNYGSRSVRACMERVIPRYLVEMAQEECRKTLNNDTRPLGDRIKDCKARFRDDFEINGDFLEKLTGKKSGDWTNSDVVKLGKYYTALKDGNTTKKDLESNFAATISGAQIKELAGIIGTDENKINILKELGYAMSELKRIPASDFEVIKKALVPESK